MIQKQNITIKASQNLAMTPRLQEAISILQMSSHDLTHYIQGQLIENPLLQEREFSLMDETKPTINEHNHREDTSYYERTQSHHEIYDKFSHISIKKTLKEYVYEQFLTRTNDKKERFVAEILIDYLQDDGYFKNDFDLIALHFKISKTLIKKVFKMLQGLDPVGIFARSIEECLTLQLKDKKQLTPSIERFLSYLPDLSKDGLLKICKKINISETMGTSILTLLKKLNPKPGNSYCNQESQPLVADVIVERDNQTNKVFIYLNPEVLPKVFLNSTYYKELESMCQKGEDLTYLKSKKNHAQWLMSALEQRATNLLKVAHAIIHSQENFFEKGITHLTPLNLKSIAEKTDLHESTISRLTRNKYIKTDLGLFDLKFFFSSKIGTNERFQKKGDSIEISSKHAQEYIKHLIDKESLKTPLSDEDLAVLLKQEGIDIARRTVAKYRKHLGIENSTSRKQMI